jgi:hypothetical protein
MFDVLTNFLWSAVDFLQTYNGAVTAVATVAIGIFTLVLVIVTRRQAILTKESVQISERALVDLDRAYIFAERIGGNFDPFVTLIEPSGVQRLIVPDFSVSLVNYGRTAGNIRLGIVRFEVLGEIPPEIEPAKVSISGNPNATAIEIIIGPDKTHTIDRLTCEQPLTQAHADGIRNGTMALYCHGYFSYLDIFGKSHSIKFCRRYVLNHREWQPIGGRERNSS